jgi:N-acetylglucosaminyldiphosphoundecaprenol N-acetyl-beta-D-mannosaminyltransferase
MGTQTPVLLASGAKSTRHRSVLGMRVDAVDYESAVGAILHWARHRRSRFICAANVHMVMEAYDRADYREMINSADLVTPDGMPLVWTLRAQGIRNASRVYGPDLMRFLLGVAERQGFVVGLYGGSPRALDRLLGMIQKCHPDLRIGYACAPPLRVLTAEEDACVVEDIGKSGVQLLFVGLGCPKQERWIADHRSTIPMPMLGVGAAFDFIAGTKRHAPTWMQRAGLEWFFRLLVEPRRLWRRYAVNNPRFLVLVLLQLFGIRTSNE